MTAAAARVSFVIYQDEPSSPASSSEELTDSIHSVTTTLAVVTAGDKENLHPVTGRRPTPEEVLGKKRKTGALATKLLIASGKAAPELHSTPKKRKLSVSSGLNRPIEKKEPKKEKRAGSISRKSSKIKAPSRVRKATELPKVEEELHVEEDATPQEKTEPGDTEAVQAAVDAKCYDLTVLPLADVSKAFEQSPPPEEKLVEDEEAEMSEDEVCLPYQSVSPSSILSCDFQIDAKIPAGDETGHRSPSATPSKRRLAVFSTPERRRIYSAFTFASPSPAAKRYARSRASSVDRFSDLDFDFATNGAPLHALQVELE